MQFKIKSTEIKISFSFFAFILLVITLDYEYSYILFVFFALLHEFVHLIFINLLSIAPKKISFTLFGANIIRDITTTSSYNNEIMINISAPIFNLVLGFVFYSVYYTGFLKESIIIKIAEINLVLGVFNLIPFYNFDGGNALKNCLLKYFSNHSTERTLTIISVITTIIFSFASIHIFFYYRSNFSLLLVSVYMIFTIVFKKQNT